MKNIMTDKLKNILKESERYCEFILLNEPVKFNDYFTNCKIDAVQVHSLDTYEIDKNHKEIVGFCGSFSWIDNELIPLDGDSYSKETPVYGYSWFKMDDDEIGLDILVDEW